MEYPKRKRVRLKDYDYSQNACYFITLCIKDRQRILCNIVGRDDLGTQSYIIQLTKYGEIVDKYINSMTQNYKTISLNKYVIMPDHIHILLTINERRAESSRPTTISQIIGVLKRLINKEIGKNIFQTSFNDHIIRDEYDYITRWNYIENNPIKWAEKEGDPQ